MKFNFFHFGLALAVVKLDFDIYHVEDDSNQLNIGQSKNQIFQKRNGFKLMVSKSNSVLKTELKFGQNKQPVDVLILPDYSDLYIPSHDVVCVDHEAYLTDLEDDEDDEDDNSDDESKNVNKRGPKIYLNKNATDLYLPPGSTTDWASIMSKIKTTDTCTMKGSFNTAGSDSFHLNESAPAYEDIDERKILSYFSKGIWGYDSVFFNDVELENLSFAVVNFTDLDIGALGIGLPILESTYDINDGNGYQYENFPMKLKSQGITNKNAYSLHLNTLQAQSGSILFGGVDHAKYEGNLTTVPMRKYNESVVLGNKIILSEIWFINDDERIPVSTRSGWGARLNMYSTYSTALYMFFDELKQLFNLTESKFGYNLYEMPCTNDTNVKIEFNFSGAKLKVPLVDLLVPTPNHKCVLGIFEEGYGFMLGQNILRSGYFVFDLEDEEISIAQLKISDKEDIEVISSAVPSAVRAENYSNLRDWYSQPTATQTGTASYSTGPISFDDDVIASIWGLSTSTDKSLSTTAISSSNSASSNSSPTKNASSDTSNSKANGDKLAIGFITSFFSLIFGILFV